MRLSELTETGVTDLVSQVASIYQQKKLIDINAARAEKGLPPVDASALAAQVQVSASPEQMQQITSLMIAGIAGLMILIFVTKRRS